MITTPNVYRLPNSQLPSAVGHRERLGVGEAPVVGRWEFA